MRRVFVFALLLSFVLCFVSAAGMPSHSKIRIASTKWFDIIYPVESENSARELFDKADSIYEKICASYGKEPDFRMPVVITPDTDAYNAYFSNGHYNHIVLFDAVSDESMAVFSEPLLGTFTHELTHAVSINMRNPFWKVIDSVFGDIFNPGSAIIMTTLFKEGAAVSMESSGGEGRLNDPFYLHMSRQAKLSGKFPSAQDVSGARDKFPSASASYGFGGPFAAFIQQKYGMEKYAEFWYRAINAKSLTYETAFKRIYDVSLGTAWKEFKDSVYVPDIPKSPLEEKFVTDFFNPEADGFSRQNLLGSRFYGLSSSDVSVSYIDGGAVWLCSAQDGMFGVPKKLFSRDGILSARLSSDGEFLAVSYEDDNSSGTKYKSALYEIKSGRWHEIKQAGLRDACVYYAEGKIYVTAVYAFSQSASLVTFAFDGKSFLRASEVSFARGESVFSPCFIEGNVYAVCRSGLEWTIRCFGDLRNSNGVKNESYSFLPDARLRWLSAGILGGKPVLLFSYAEPDTFPRLGWLDPSSKEMFLMNTDVSGGVYWPVAAAGSVVYSSYFYDNRKLLCLDTTSLDNAGGVLKLTAARSAVNESSDAFSESHGGSFGGSVASGADGFAESGSGSLDNAGSFESVPGSAEGTFSSKKYRKPYWHRGTLLTGPVVPGYQLIPYVADDVKGDSLINTVPFVWGLTWMTSNPWDSDTLTLSAGTSFDAKAWGFSAGFSGSTSTSLFSYSEMPAVVVDRDGFVQASNNLSLSSGVNLGGKADLLFSLENKAFFGKNTWGFGGLILDYIEDDNLYFYDKNKVSAKISTIRKKGPGTFELGGIALSVAYKTVVMGTAGGRHQYNVFNEGDDMVLQQYLYPEVSVNIPRLLPFSCRDSFTYNLPVAFNVQMCSYIGKFLSFEAESVIFAYEIQRGIPFVPLYFNRFLLTADYCGSLGNSGTDYTLWNFVKVFSDLSGDRMGYRDFLSLKLILEPSFNTGLFANPSSHVSVYCSVGLPLKDFDPRNFKLSFGVGSLF